MRGAAAGPADRATDAGPELLCADTWGVLTLKP